MLPWPVNSSENDVRITNRARSYRLRAALNVCVWQIVCRLKVESEKEKSERKKAWIFNRFEKRTLGRTGGELWALESQKETLFTIINTDIIIGVAKCFPHSILFDLPSDTARGTVEDVNFLSEGPWLSQGDPWVGLESASALELSALSPGTRRLPSRFAPGQN